MKFTAQEQGVWSNMNLFPGHGHSKLTSEQTLLFSFEYSLCFGIDSDIIWDRVLQNYLSRTMRVSAKRELRRPKYQQPCGMGQHCYTKLALLRLAIGLVW